MNAIKLLNTPFPRPKRNRRNLLWVCLIGLSCSLFIILFKPFGIENVNEQWFYELAIISIGVVFILAYLFIEWLIPYCFPSIFNKWTLKKAILWYTLVMLFIGAVVFLYKSFLAGFSNFTLLEYFFVIARTLGMALIVTFFSLGLYQYFNRKNVSLFSNSEEYYLTIEGGKALRIKPKNILYISSDDNYVDIHFLDNGKRKKEVLRSSLKNIESQLVNQISPIYRCHRRHLINIEYFNIQKMTSRSMLISLKEYEDQIPVSKKYTEIIRQLLTIRP
ncbi:MAG: LytTR family transcriptional regulator DNA-binding domain-containing protein [Bacteroidota bacterium]